LSAITYIGGILKKISKNSIYIILNLIYIIPGILGALLFLASFYFYDILYSILSIFNFLYFTWIYFYIMSLNFTILIHPIIQIIIYILVWKNKIISQKNIIIVFILSAMIAFIFLYLKGRIATA
jgi:hypothetical protein